MLSLAPPRDRLAARRRELALAALALLAYQRDDTLAVAALLDATRHSHPQVRAMAIFYLRCIYFGVEEFAFFEPQEQPSAESQPSETDGEELPALRREVPAEVIERLSEIAAGDPTFEPRFQARSFLGHLGRPVPLDNPEGVYDFKVRFRHDKSMYRTIAVRSDQTLEDLHLAIQGALRWDNDHLYSFFVNGKLYDERYRFSSPWEEDNPPWTDQAVIGELGLTPKHKFLYLFDYGDSHEFEVEVVDVKARAERGAYPRVVESKGKAPAQYWYGDEDEDGEEDDEDDQDDV
jgi:hypothetical protein